MSASPASSMPAQVAVVQRQPSRGAPVGHPAAASYGATDPPVGLTVDQGTGNLPVGQRPDAPRADGRLVDPDLFDAEREGGNPSCRQQD